MTRLSASDGPLVRGAAVALLTLGLLVAVSHLLPPFAVWITDNGNKYIVMRNFAETGKAAVAHRAPEFFPTGGFHFVRHPSGYRSFYAEYYPRFAARWWSIFGERAPGWLSMLGAATAAGMMAAVLRRRHPLLPFLLIVATPMFFFSFLLWEMTWSVCAAFAAWLLLEHKHPAAAGLVLGVSLLLREEAYCFAAALLAAMAWDRDFRTAGRFIVGMALATIPLWMWQYGEFGHILGLHGGNYYTNNRAAAEFSLMRELAGALWNYYHHLLRFDAFDNPWLNRLCLFPVCIAVVVGGFTARRFDRLRTVVGAAAAAGWLVLIWGFLARDTGSEAFSAALLTGAVGTNPLFLPFYLNWRRAWLSRSRTIRNAAVTACVYLLIVPPLLTRNDIGLIYGARHFLCIAPLLLLLSAHFYRLFPEHRHITRPSRSADSDTGRPQTGRRHRIILPLTAAVLATALQWGAFTALRHVARESAELERQINALPEKTLVTDVFFLPEQTPHLFFTKMILQLDDGNAAKLSEYLKANNSGGFILILSADPRFRRISNPKLAKFLDAASPAAPPIRFRMIPGSGFMDLHIVRCRLK